MNDKRTLVIGLLLPAANTVAFIWLSVASLIHRDLSAAIAAPTLIRVTLVLAPILCSVGLITALLSLRKSPRSPTAWTAALATATTLAFLACCCRSFLGDF